jgi:predicted amidohydrolase
MKIALAQIYPTLGNLAANYALLEKETLAARQNGARLIIFPELALTGYLLKDQVYDLLPLAREYLAKLTELSRGIDLLFGSIEEQNSRAYNAAFYLSGGELIHTHRKVYLPTYGMFDEKRYFSAGSQFQTFASVLGQTAILICEDAWHFSSAYLAASAGAENVVIISSSPYRAGIAKQWQNINRSIAENLVVNVFYCNRAGVEDGVTFWGGSAVYTNDGQLLGGAAELKSETLFLDLPENREARQQSVFVRDERPEVVLKELSRIWRTEL